jgi:hypothetical protein
LLFDWAFRQGFSKGVKDMADRKKGSRKSGHGSDQGSEFDTQNNPRVETSSPGGSFQAAGSEGLGAARESEGLGAGFVNRPQMNGGEEFSMSGGGQGMNLSRYVEDLRGVFGNVRDIPESGREIISRLDRSAHQNPWLHIGIAGFGALLLGLAVGRSASRSSDVSTSMGRSYEDFDDALDE